jgi:hypothetical protein
MWIRRFTRNPMRNARTNIISKSSNQSVKKLFFTSRFWVFNQFRALWLPLRDSEKGRIRSCLQVDEGSKPAEIFVQMPRLSFSQYWKLPFSTILQFSFFHSREWISINYDTYKQDKTHWNKISQNLRAQKSQKIFSITFSNDSNNQWSDLFDWVDSSAFSIHRWSSEFRHFWRNQFNSHFCKSWTISSSWT